MSVELVVEITAPCWATSRNVAARTPPALKLPRDWLSTTLVKSVSTRLYPNVPEFAMLSEIVAIRTAFTASP